MREVLQTAIRPGVDITRIMFCACLSHSQAMAYLSQMFWPYMTNDVEHGKSYYRTTPKGVEYLATLNNMYELLQMETKTLQIKYRCMDFGLHSACTVSSPVEAPCTECHDIMFFEIKPLL